MIAARVLRLGAACLLGLAVVSTPAAAATGAAGDAPVEVSLSRAQVSTPLGGSFDFASTVRNTGKATVSGLVAHLNVVGLSEDIYVDPEDWSEERTKRLAPLRPGESAEVSWSVKAVTGGEAAIYVVVLPSKSPAAQGKALAVSPALDVSISERRTLNTGGVLPLALGVPALLGLAALSLRIRRR